jgi:methylmalonyl-CoA mutase N-terminal domain/subunit
VSIAALPDMERLFEGIPRDRVTVSMTINATASILVALHAVAAEQSGIPASALGGTVQNDVLKEFVARGCYIYPPAPSLRLAVDLIEHAVRHMPRWNFISVSGYHIREAGATAAQELGFTIANGIEYVAQALKRGLDPDAVGQRISFFFNAHNDFLEEVAKFRAARRLWARVMRDRFGARDPRAMMCRFHVQTAGSTLTAQQPHNNVVRVALQAMAAVLGGAQSLHTNAMDEALALPTEHAARLALRTQQIIAHEIGVQDVADPFGGSWHVERETDRLEREASAFISEIDARGGAAASIRYEQQEIEKSAVAAQRAVEDSRAVVVGVNRYVEPAEQGRLEILRADPAVPASRAAAVAEVRRSRDAGRAKAALDRLTAEARGTASLFPATLECVRSHVTLGEISAALRTVFGTHDPS